MSNTDAPIPDLAGEGTEVLGAVISAAATLAAMYLFYSPMPEMREAYRRGSVGEKSFFPFIATWLAASCWTIYGAAIGAIFPIVVCNMFGVCCATLFCGIFVQVARPSVRSAAVRKAFIAVGIVGGVCGYLLLNWADLKQRQYAIARVGAFASVATVSQYSSPLAVARDVVRSRSSEALSFPMTIGSLLCSSLWLTYGAWILKDINVVVPNLLGLVASAAQLALFARYPKRPAPQGGASPYNKGTLEDGDVPLMTVDHEG